MIHFLLVVITPEKVESFLTNLTTITQSAEQTFVVLSTFISTGIGGVLIAVKQVKKRMKSADVSAAVDSTALNHLEELIKQEQTEIETLQKNLNLRCTTLEDGLSTLRKDLLVDKTPKEGKS
jgi:hypothetical protein